MGKKKKTQIVSKAACHTGHKHIFTTDNGIEVWAGGKNRVGGWHTMEPYAQVAIGPSETMGEGYAASSNTEVPEGWSCERHVVVEEPPVMVSIDWPDFGVPNLPVEFWTSLCTDLITHNITTVSTQCAGGHGRTGVQLSILAYLLSPSKHGQWKDAHDLIQWVREQHCTHAVETNGQQQYVADACGIPVGKSTVHLAPATPPMNFFNTKSRGTGIHEYDHLFTDDNPDEHEENYCNKCDILHYEDELLKKGICPQCDCPMGVEDKLHNLEDNLHSCPACGTKNSINFKGVCKECDYDLLLEDEDNTKYSCMACVTTLSNKMFIGNSHVCVICETEYMKKGTLTVKKGNVKIKCTQCKKSKPSKHIRMISKEEVICYGCY